MKRLIALLISLSLSTAGLAQSSDGIPWEVAGGPVHEGDEVQIDMPEEYRFKNTETRGKGNCVWTSVKHAAYWQQIPELYPIISWLDEGGGWPEKLDELIKAHAPKVEYVQYEGPDPGPLLELALATGRIACVTYGYGKLYRDPRTGQMMTIYHMVNNTRFKGSKAAILDNNDPKHDTWMAKGEFLKRAKHPSGSAWVVVFLASPPPPYPTN